MLENEIRELIIEALSLEDIKPDEINCEEALFGEGLGLDSIDALELGVAIAEKFGISIDPKDERINEHFYSVQSLAGYIADRRVGS